MADSGFVDEQVIRAASGFDFEMEDLGIFTIISVSHERGHRTCHVHLNSIKAQLRGILGSGPPPELGKKINVQLKANVDRDTVKCKGPGKSCVATIVVKGLR